MKFIYEIKISIFKIFYIFIYFILLFLDLLLISFYLRISWSVKENS